MLNFGYGKDYGKYAKESGDFAQQAAEEAINAAQDVENAKNGALAATESANTAAANADEAAGNADNKVAELATYNERVEDIETELVYVHLSTIKGKTFIKLDDRFEELESDTYFPATNLITNGDFSQGTTGWINNGGTLSVSDNTAVITSSSDALGNYVGIYQTLSNAPNGHKYYISFSIKPKTISELLRVGFGDTYENTFPTVPNQWNTISRVVTKTSNSNITLVQRSGGFYPVGQTIEFKYVLTINLTRIFGAGNEPTKEEMDKILSFYPNSFFDGTVNLAENKKMLMFLLNEIRANKTALGLKADKVQEAWIVPTYLNGFTSALGGARFRKDGFGRVRIEGGVGHNSIPLNVTLFTLPIGYRPPSTRVYVQSYVDNANAIIYVKNNGDVSLIKGPTPATAVTWLALDGIEFDV